MKRARTFTRVEMEDAVRLAAEHGLRLVMKVEGEIEFTPTAPPPAESVSKLDEWRKRQRENTGDGRAHR